MKASHSPMRERLRARRRMLVACAGAPLLSMLGGCESAALQPVPWQARLSGDGVVLLGEVHDNAEQHRLRLAVLRRALAAGWRPALVMEQFDTDRQVDIDRARREQPGNAQFLIDRAAPANSGWDWTHYRGFVELALDNGLPLIAGNLSRTSATQVARRGLEATFGAERLRELGLDRPIEQAWQAAQEREIHEGHCAALPASALPGLALAQFARDAVMAELLRRHARHGALLLAGNGHVRRDIGVPRWLGDLDPRRLFVVGYLEPGGGGHAGRFDAEVVTPAAVRPDPCAAFRSRARPGSV